MEICCAYRPIIMHICMTMTKKASLKRHLFHRCAIKVLNDNKLEYGNDLLPSTHFNMNAFMTSLLHFMDVVVS